MLAYSLAHPALDSIAHDRCSECAPYGKADARSSRPLRVCPPEKEDGHVAGKVSPASFVHLFKIGVLQKACRFGKTFARRFVRRHRSYSRKPGFTVTRLRPLARRRESTAFPLLVFMRLRKPCFLER